MTFHITSLYAAALGLLAIALTFHVIVMRARSGVSFLHGDNMALAERIRRHGNFMEFVPLALLLLALAEAAGASRMGLHLSGGLLLAARLIHPFGIIHDRSVHPARVIGALGTVISMLIAIGLICWTRFMS
mgnify:CR=1 FL=1